MISPGRPEISAADEVLSDRQHAWPWVNNLEATARRDMMHGVRTGAADYDLGGCTSLDLTATQYGVASQGRAAMTGGPWPGPTNRADLLHSLGSPADQLCLCMLCTMCANLRSGWLEIGGRSSPSRAWLPHHSCQSTGIRMSIAPACHHLRRALGTQAAAQLLVPQEYRVSFDLLPPGHFNAHEKSPNRESPST